MDRAAEVAFAWALLDSARSFLDESARAWLCAKLGAGETQCVVRELLAGYVSSNTRMPAVLAAALWSWANGFAGSEEQATIHDTIIRIRPLVEVAPPEGEGEQRVYCTNL